MINGSSFWLWIGYDTEKRADLYVMGESISDLLVNMDAQGFFDDAERIGDLKPLTTWEIVNMISYQINQRYYQIKLLEIMPDNEEVFDYSRDRDKAKDIMLESQEDLLIETTLLTQSEKIQFVTKGAEATIRKTYNVLREKGLNTIDQPENIELVIRYLHPGKTDPHRSAGRWSETQVHILCPRMSVSVLCSGDTARPFGWSVSVRSSNSHSGTSC